VEYVRNVLGIKDAEHEENNPDAPNLVISALSCSLKGTVQRVIIVPGTQAHRMYPSEEAKEAFRCGCGLNPGYLDRIVKSGFRIAGMDDKGEIRIIELPTRPFFIATLFLPQLVSEPGRPHPLIVGYLKAALAQRHGGERGNVAKMHTLW